MRKILLFTLAAFGLTFRGAADLPYSKPTDAYFAPYPFEKAPAAKKSLLREGDRLAICGDSITEQKKYSRIMETYLTVCVPQLGITVRQYGWSGEKAPGFLKRMTNDCLRFNPTVATTCYGMNDCEYRPYEDSLGATYRDYEKQIDEAFKAHGVRVVEGSAGCIGKPPAWRQNPVTLEQLNVNLANLRNIGLEVAKDERVGFADVFWPMLVEAHVAQERYGTNFTVAGKDGVHPDWAGHVVMAYAFLHSFGLDGNIGTLTVDLKGQRARASAGHEVLNYKDGELQVRSTRYPYCFGEGDPSKDNNQLAGSMLVPFNEELNRFMLVVRHPKAKSYVITWGDQSHTFSAEQLTHGINLAKEFPSNPFSPAFEAVDNAVAAKQAFETTEIKKFFHGSEGQADMEGTVANCEKQREPLAEAIKTVFVPVTHTIKIVPQNSPE